ncbi:ImmA/IrrE family metallo-endopeptidase [Maritalea sp. S77]|jgi:Zn-dependent peptidase ImmA (M78 family)|uniref:ImmA/IrrE family metallo-endopeptidase n=1 Tax=Maritalea sp. S77 TaxID=3415125 RepID=UPI003C7CFF27
MRRGFKAHAERVALAARSEVDLAPNQRIDPIHFLTQKGITVWTPEQIPNLSQDCLEQLTVNDPNSWSGMTIREAGQLLIIYNSTHSEERNANTLMHEWAHLELDHKPNRVDRSAGNILLLSDYPSEFEDEADWLAASILLPRDGLLYHGKRGLNSEQIAAHFGVSKALANWRIRMTGIGKQLSIK